MQTMMDYILIPPSLSSIFREAFLLIRHRFPTSYGRSQLVGDRGRTTIMSREVWFDLFIQKVPSSRHHNAAPIP